VTTVSRFSAAQLVRLGICGPDKILVIPNGHEHTLRYTPRHTAATRAAAGRDTIVLLGSLAPHKNVGAILSMAGELAAIGLRIAIVGSSDPRIFQKGGAPPPAAAANVLWLGPLEGDALAALLQDSLCLAFPSLAEGFGLPPLEAMALGCPVVASDRASLPEICGSAALFAAEADLPPGSGISQPGERRAAASRSRGAGKIAGGGFRWSDSAVAYLEAMARIDQRRANALAVRRRHGPSFIGLAVFAALARHRVAPRQWATLRSHAGAAVRRDGFRPSSALGGATPQVYALFAIALLAATLLRRRAVSGAGDPRPGPICLGGARLIVLAIGGTIMLPRWFAGETVVFVPIQRGYVESPLRPIWRNIAQGGYFALDALLYFAVAVLLLEKPRRALLSKAFFAWCITHTALGLIDLAAKYAGRGDVFAALRTANYATLSGHMVASFPRLTGALPEAAAFAAMTLGCLAFSFSYWRGTGSRIALCLALCDLVLLALSTSSTAYAALPIVCAPLAWRIGRGIVRGRLWGKTYRSRSSVSRSAGVALVVFWIDGPAAFLSPSPLRGHRSPAPRAVSSALISTRSASGTSSIRRASGSGSGARGRPGWAIAVVSQLGLPGAVLMAVLVAVLLRAMAGIRRMPENAALLATGDGVCAGAVGEVVAATLSGGSADPDLSSSSQVAAVTVAAPCRAMSARRMIQATGLSQPTGCSRRCAPSAQVDLTTPRHV
jgi:hypothetical protein